MPFLFLPSFGTVYLPLAVSSYDFGTSFKKMDRISPDGISNRGFPHKAKQDRKANCVWKKAEVDFKISAAQRALRKDIERRSGWLQLDGQSLSRELELA